MAPFEAGVLSNPTPCGGFAYAQAIYQCFTVRLPLFFVPKSSQWRVGQRIEGAQALAASVTLQTRARPPLIYPLPMTMGTRLLDIFMPIQKSDHLRCQNFPV